MPSAQQARRGNALKSLHAAPESASERAVMALGMLLVPLIAFGVVLGISLIISAD
jgi:hypothetical protein